ncbi:FAD-binding oxidoreductase [Saccharopolyspora sp. MS10]|uniref:FAD-binding oxidoreductase n=1 Tax=Saccharopolyspora sp. MS10 TaxID=3385973 RepID=UPI0039A206E0
MPATAAALAAAVDDRLRAATAADDIAGIRPTWVAEADSTDQVAALLRTAAAHGLTTLPRGSGGKLDWGAPPGPVDLVLDLSRHRGVVEHAAGDLVLTARAGTPLRDLREAVARAGQQLAIDPPFPTATAGGTVATATSGPGRYHFGGVRDLLIGVTVVLADGTTTTSGGTVVKNVAGYDLGKLYTGSFGTLGVITEVVFRLHPLPAERRWITATAESTADAAALVAAHRRSRAAPTALELDRPEPGAPLTVSVQLEGSPGTTHDRATELARSTGGQVSERAPAWWGQAPATGTRLRLGTEPAALSGLLDTADRAARDTGLPLALRGSAGLGVLHAFLPEHAEPGAVRDLVTALRAHPGYTAVERAEPAVHGLLDPQGPRPAVLHALHRQIKDRFDPEHRLAPGRLAGGTP